MSRVANSPIELPSGVEVKVDGQALSVKGSKGELAFDVHTDVSVSQEEGALKFAAIGGERGARAMAGTRPSSWGERK